MVECCAYRVQGALADLGLELGAVHLDDTERVAGLAAIVLANDVARSMHNDAQLVGHIVCEIRCVAAAKAASGGAIAPARVDVCCAAVGCTPW